MILERKPHYKQLHKKLLRLKANPLNNNKFLKLILESVRTKTVYRRIAGQVVKKEIVLRRFAEIAKKKRKKWEPFLRMLVKANKFFQKYRPYTFHSHNVSKFASQGNSFTKQYRKDLITKKIFNNYYGGLRRKYLKKQMTKVFKSSQLKNSSRNICAELFESRLDSVLKKASFCSTIKEARQIIKHKHIKVNGTIESNYAHILKQGDYVQVKHCSRSIIKPKLKNKFSENFNLVIWPLNPGYLNINYNTLEIVFGDVNGFRFSSSFTFKNDLERVVESHYRH
jgi:ribosomal protein S4